MKKWKGIIAGVIFMSIAAELTGCIPNIREQKAQAVQLLNDKYHEDFEIERFLGQESMNDYYEVLAFSTEYPEVLFEARAARDGSYIMDEYVASRVCRKVEQQLEEQLGGLAGYTQVKVQAVSKSIDSAEADMSIQEFMSLKAENKFAVYLIYSPVQMDPQKVYQTLTGMFTGLECMSGSIQLYVTSEKILQQTQIYLEQTAKVDYEFDEALEFTEPITVPFENGRIRLTENEFIEMAGDRL